MIYSYSKIFNGGVFINFSISGCYAEVAMVSRTVFGEQNAIVFLMI